MWTLVVLCSVIASYGVQGDKRWTVGGVVTGQPSCRYNCGRHMGSCSCSSSCQYYGNCCHDYHYECSATTTKPDVTSGQPSCRYNCGRHMGSCSCSSSCQYYGNCCHDYHYECSATTTKPDVTSGYSSCGGYLYGYNGSLSSPNYPYAYPHNEDCIWYIRPGSSVIRLQFSSVYIEGCGNCVCDSVSVYDGSSTGSTLLGKVCGTNTATFYSTGSYLTVRFSTDSSVSSSGFEAYYEVGDFSSTETPVTEQPSCRYNCGRNMGSCSCRSSCQYNGNCCPDYYNYCLTSSVAPEGTSGQPSCRYNCGRHMGSCSCSSSCQYYGNCCYDYYYYCPALTTAPVTTDYTSCGGYLYGYSGNFTSPNYPSAYPNNAECIWYIRPGSSVIQLQFSSVNIEDHSSCSYDAIYVYDGYNTAYRLLGKMCGNTTATFHSTSVYMTVRFKSDSIINSSGFRAEYRVVAQGSCRYNCGYQVGSCSCSSSCEYRGNCCSDYYDECSASTTETPSPTGQPSCRYNCGSHMGSCSCSSSCRYYGNCCYDYYYECSATTTKPDVTTGYSSCGGYLYGYSGSLSSPNYPYAYPHNADCIWYIRPGSSVIRLRFSSVNIEYCGNCVCDSVSVYNGYSTSSSLLGKVCGTNTATFYSTGPYLTVRFRTDGSASSSGFRAYYEVVDNFSTESPVTAPPCGGYLFGSGNFSSPNHPSYYPDNTYCTWRLRASSDQRIFLAFTYMQLDNCCECDYIKVYDGSSYMGTVCNSNLTTFHSSSNSMTVVFRTDGSVVARGFKAEFISSLPTRSGQVTCSSDNMNIVVQRSYLNSLGYDGNNLYLNDEHCRPQISSYQVVFRFPIESCGNNKKIENGRVVYTNTLRADTSSYGEITRQVHLKLNVACQMDQDSVSQIMYLVENLGNSSIVGTGKFNTSMNFYTSSSFYYQVTQVPYKVSLNQNLYVQVDLSRQSSNLVIFLDTCVTSPSPHDFENRSYYLVRNGCPVDSTYRPYYTGLRPYARFTFKTFQFLRAAESVYIQCKVLICPASDSNSRCHNPPNCRNRVARDLGTEHDSQTLVLGPIQLRASEKKEEGTEEQDEA